MLQTLRLRNGLRVHLYDQPDKKSVCLGAIAYGGGSEDPVGLEGIHHALEHMVFRGTAEFPTNFDLMEPIERFGGEARGFTDIHLMGFHVELPAREFKLALRYLAEILFRPLLRPEDWETERRVIECEIAMLKDSLDRSLGQKLRGSLYPGTLLARPVIGTEETLGNIQVEDLERVWKKNFTPANLDLIFVGRLPGDASGEIEREFGKIQLAPGQRSGRISVPDSPAQSRVEIRDQRIEQAWFYIGNQIPDLPSPPEYQKAQFFNLMLGEDDKMATPLFQELRRKQGLYYQGGSKLAYLAPGVGWFVFICRSESERFDGLFEAYRKIWNETLNDPVRFEFARDQLLARIEMSENDPAGKFNSIVNTLVYGDRWMEDGEEEAVVRRISHKEVRDFVHRYLSLEKSFMVVMQR